MKYLYLDTETGGFDPQKHALLAVAVVAVQDGGVLDSMQCYVLPESQPWQVVDAESVEVNGYTPENWVELGAVELPVAMRELQEFIARHPGAPLVAHNAAFDRKFLDAAATRCGLEPVGRARWRCTQVLMGQLMDLGLIPEGSIGLDRLLELMGAPARVDVHTAAEDAWLCALGHAWLLGLLRERMLERAEAVRELDEARVDLGAAMAKLRRLHAAVAVRMSASEPTDEERLELLRAWESAGEMLPVVNGLDRVDGGEQEGGAA